MDAPDGGAIRNHVQSRDLVAKQPTLQTRMDSTNLSPLCQGVMKWGSSRTNEESIVSVLTLFQEDTYSLPWGLSQ